MALRERDLPPDEIDSIDTTSLRSGLFTSNLDKLDTINPSPTPIYRGMPLADLDCWGTEADDDNDELEQLSAQKKTIVIEVSKHTKNSASVTLDHDGLQGIGLTELNKGYVLPPEVYRPRDPRVSIAQKVVMESAIGVLSATRVIPQAVRNIIGRRLFGDLPI